MDIMQKIYDMRGIEVLLKTKQNKNGNKLKTVKQRNIPMNLTNYEIN